MGAQHEVGGDEIARVFPAVAEIVADALAREVDEVSLESRLIEDLGAESIDFLDIVFRLEQRFSVQIPRGQIVEDARGELAEDEFERDGRLTAAAAERLRAYLTEVAAERVRAGMRTAEIPMLFTVATFCKLVVRAERSRGR
jgi:acyl carrier protein